MINIEEGILMVELREITEENYEECLNLNIADSQKNFVSSNVHSLAQAWVYYDTAFPFAIYADDVMVGFIMLGYYEVKGYYTLWKFMIDEKYQNKGYGKKALRLGIDYLVKRFKVKEVYTAYYSTNHIARDLYASIGFCETGEIVGNEIGMKLIISNIDYSSEKRVIDSLTKRENEILIQIANGLSNKEIATSLNICERTVKNHLFSIYRKIDVSDRTQAAIYAIKNDIVGNQEMI